jgi:hypothetical protein
MISSSSSSHCLARHCEMPALQLREAAAAALAGRLPCLLVLLLQRHKVPSSSTATHAATPLLRLAAAAAAWSSW